MSDAADPGAGRDFKPPTSKTLATCDDEPIHRPGAVQPHGCLFEVEDESLRISCVSSNLRAVLGIGTSAALGRPLREVLGQKAADWAAAQLAQLPPATLAAQAMETRDKAGTLIVHRYLQRCIVEWLADEEHRFPVPAKLEQKLAATLASARQAADMTTLLQTLAEGVKAASGYDRVMVYRFHRDWHGEIVGEKTEPGLSAYRGLHYPASDIPAQARRLYVETRARVIADVYARDATLMAGENSKGPIDLSHAVLRSVSPVHIQYLRNMGSGATLVTTLLVEGALWGLIACHHRQSHSVPWYAFERLRRFTDDAAAVVEQRFVADRGAREQWQAVGRQRLGGAASPAERLTQLMELVGAEGVIACAGGHVMTLGQVPTRAHSVVRWVLEQPADLGMTDALHERFPAARSDTSCAGLAWVVLGRAERAAVLLVRPEFERTVSWGGNPEKAVLLDPVTRRLNPRGSFDLWKQTVSGRSRPWEADATSLLEFFQAHQAAAAWVHFVMTHGQPV